MIHPGDMVDKNPPANAGDMRQIPGGEFNPWSEKIPHVTEQLSLGTTTTEPTHSRACALQQEKPLHRKAHAPQLESSPYSLQLEKIHTQQWRPTTIKNKKRIFKICKN